MKINKKKIALILAVAALSLTSLCSCKGRDGKDVTDRNSEVVNGNNNGNGNVVDGIADAVDDIGDNVGSDINGTDGTRKNIPDNNITKDSPDSANIS